MAPVTITGRATINTDPYRMMAESQVTGFGAITVRVDGTRLWETGGGNYGLDGRGLGDGEPMSGFASLVSGTLGEGPGALTMLTLASPNGYLNLQKEAVAGVTAAGVGTVDGAPVTYYEVTIDPARLLEVPGLTGEQTKTINAGARPAGSDPGYETRTTKVGIDAAGLIRETTTVNTFSDGSSQTTRSTFSNFGCAGIVALPGDPEITTEPTPCAATVPTAPIPTTTIPPSTDTTVTVPPTTATTIGGASPPTTTSAAQQRRVGELEAPRDHRRVSRRLILGAGV